MLGSLPASRSVPGCCPAGRGVGKVPVRLGGSGHFCRDARRDAVRGPCRAREARGLAHRSPPARARTSQNHERVLGGPQPLRGSPLVPPIDFPSPPPHRSGRCPALPCRCTFMRSQLP